MNQRKELEPEDMIPLVSYLNDVFLGDLQEFNQNISKAIYILHYVSEEDVSKEEVIHISFNLQQLIEHVYKCHLRQNE